MKSRRAAFLLTLNLAVSLVAFGCGGTDSTATNPDGSAVANKDSKSSSPLGRIFSSTKPITLPAGTEIDIVLDQSIASNQAKSGDEFDASLSAPIALNAKTIVPKGARVKGRVIEARESGRLKGTSLLRLELVSIEVEGKDFDIATNAISRSGGDHKTRNTVLIGGGTAAGAVIGGIAGGGKGAAIGAAAGAGAGTAGAAITGKKEITLPAETLLQFKLAQPATVEVKG